jgi:hypothetical protein
MVWPLTFIVLTSVVTLFIRWFGEFENKAEAVGSDLNLVAFGFAIELLVQLMKGETILPKWQYRLPTLVPVIALIVLNILMYMFNLRLSKNIESRDKSGNTGQARMLRGVSIFCGVLSAVSFAGAEGFWG